MKRIYLGEYGDGHMLTCADPDKERILGYLRTAKPVAVAAGYFRDEMTGETLVGMDDLGYVSGGYSWSTKDIYHFERYDLALELGFRTHALGSL